MWKMYGLEIFRMRMSSIDTSKYSFQLNVVFSDPDILVVNKPAGLPVYDAISNKKSLLNELHSEFGETQLRVVNRIDQPVSGLVVFARNKAADMAMSELFRERKVYKEYWAVVQGKVQEAGELRDRLFHNKRVNKSFVSDKKQAKESILKYEVASVLDNYSLLKVTLETGRHHQIRVQLAHVGHPVKGDVKYGARRGNRDRSIYLHARGLTFLHPFSREEVRVVANPIQDVIWSLWPQEAPEL